MAATLMSGPRQWTGGRDSEGHRTWNLRSLVRTDSKLDGPQAVLACAGLPSIGSQYSFGNDADSWAFCYPDATIQMLESNNDHTGLWAVDQKFSTRPLRRCNQTTITNPLSEPQRIGGSFVNFTRPAVYDLYGNPILSSSWELLRGREVEFDEAYPTVWVEQNTLDLGLELFSQYINCVNDAPMWGLSERCVKLSRVSRQRLSYGVCTYYFMRRFEFDINYNTFDRYVQDEGTRVLNGHHGTPGSGCTINITAVDSFNAITAATIASGGSGYAPSSTLSLAVQDSGGGSGATISVQTNGSGIVTSVVVISFGGSGYSVSSGIATTGTGWILDNINGSPPNPNNPQHFIRYKDRNGENSRVILDGYGQPAINKYPGQRFIQKYPGVNLMLLGVPAAFTL